LRVIAGTGQNRTLGRILTARLLAATKFSVPVLPGRYVPRQRLHAALDAAAELTVVRYLASRLTMREIAEPAARPEARPERERAFPFPAYCSGGGSTGEEDSEESAGCASARSGTGG
jgi:hypothetical protein